MDEIESRTPNNPQAEKSVLGSMLIEPRCISDVLESLKPEHFYFQSNREIFETIQAMFNFGKAIDPVTVLSEMKQRGVYREESRAYFAELIRTTPTAANVMEYAAILIDTSLQRDLEGAATHILNTLGRGGSANEMLDIAERAIYALRNGQSIGGLKPISEVVQSVYDNLSKVSENGGRIPGLSTGLPDLDKRILGLGGGELILIASRPGMGKTSIALNMALNIAKISKKTVAVFSLEMSKDQLVTRLLSSESLVPVEKLMRADLSAEEWRRLIAAAESISRCNILIDDNPMMTVAEILGQCRRVKDLGLVVIDYLQLMQSAGGKPKTGENRQQIVSDMSRMLKIMAKDLNVPVLCLSQLNRASADRKDKRPLLSDLRESGAIEQDADVVIGLYREGYYDKDCPNPNAAEAIILKNRKGQTDTVNLIWMGEYTAYVSAEYRHNA